MYGVFEVQVHAKPVAKGFLIAFMVMVAYGYHLFCFSLISKQTKSDLESIVNDLTFLRLIQALGCSDEL